MKYNCLAGDCANATNFFGAGAQPDQTTNGNGSGTVDGNTADSANGIYLSTERAYFFDHLANAKLISMGTFDEAAADMTNITAGNGYPKTPIGNGFFVFNALGAGGEFEAEGGGHAFLLGIVPTIEVGQYIGFDTRDFTGNQFVTAPDAFAIDSKIDDGLPLSGKVVTLGSASLFDGETTWYFDQPDAPGAGSCTSNAASNPYSSDNNDSCSLSIKEGF